MSKLKNEVLNEINEVYIEHKDFLLGGKLRHTLLVGAENENLWEFYKLISDQAGDKFRSVCPELTLEEWLDAYENSTLLLKRHVHGAMAMDKFFDDGFIPLMKREILEDSIDSNYQFLWALKKRLSKKELLPLLRKALSSQFYSVQQEAIAVAEVTEITEVLPEIEKLMDDPTAYIFADAERYMKKFRKGEA